MVRKLAIKEDPGKGEADVFTLSFSVTLLDGCMWIHQDAQNNFRDPATSSAQ